MAGWATGIHAETSGVAAPMQWAKQRAVTLDGIELHESDNADLAPILVAAGNARVVGFSEGWHKAHEFLAFRNRLFAYLVEHGGVTAYAGETGFTDAVAVDDYVLGRTEFSEAAVRGVFAWEQEPIAENRELVEWLRAHNAKPTTQRPVRFYGIDMTGAQRFKRAPMAVEAVLDYLAMVDGAMSRQFSDRFRPRLRRFNAEDYPSLASTDRDAVTLAIGDLQRQFESNRLAWIEKSSALSFERAYRNAVVVRQLNDMFRTTSSRNLGSGYSDREPGMSENLRWVLEQEGAAGRVFLFEQVGHLARMGTRTGPHSRPPLGAYLHTLLGRDYWVIAGLWGEGSIGRVGEGTRDVPPMQVGVFGPLTEVLMSVERPLFFLDLRQMPPLRQQQEFSGRAADYFDAAVFFRSISPLHAYR